ncbi:MAG TPA: hypothetical protein VD993_11255 [Chitinophagaceae bacterium]|nr:hypothetical protein [Chitinophagaceae bacterium]
MKQQITTLLLILFASVAVAQSRTDSCITYFKEIEQATRQHQNLWNKNLYAPILLVDPQTREIITNIQDSAGTLTPFKTAFTGKLPDKVNISNTSIQWNGTHWAMIMLPLPKDKKTRINLIAHELFHRAQRSLGFKAHNPDNAHLDEKDARIYLRLELEALKNALAAASMPEIKKHIANALAFRKHRYALYPTADSTESRMELNEGICEYTGIMHSGRTSQEARAWFKQRIDAFLKSPSYIRSFAYEAVPVYGYLLNAINPGWNKKINDTTNLTSFFQTSFNVQLPADANAHITKTALQYKGEIIVTEENARAEQIRKQKEAYIRMFLEAPATELPLMNMNMSFDYTKMVSLNEKGMVYPHIRITDKWGILTAAKGALISSDWSKVRVSFPTSIEGTRISGDGWTLELAAGYTLVKDDAGGYELRQQ